MSDEVPLTEFSDAEASPLSEYVDTPVGKLPADWDIEWLDDVCSINPDGFSTDEWPADTFDYVSLSDVSEGTILQSNSTPVDDAPSRAQRQIQQGDVLVGTVRPKQVSHGLVTKEYDGDICSSGFGVLRPGARVNTHYLMQEVLYHRFFRQMEAYVAGSGYPAVKHSDLRKHRVAVPSLTEQRKIASVLYTIDQLIQKTEEILKQANRIKKGIIQDVFENGTKDQTGKQETKSGVYPAAWELVRFEDLFTNTQYGTNKKSNTDGDGYPTLRIPNVVGKRLTLDDLKYTPVDDTELDQLRLEEDDLLIVRTNGNPEYVGQCITFPGFDDDYVYASYLIRLRVDETRVLPAYIREFLNSERGRAEMRGWIRSSAGNYNLSVGALEKFQIPVPPLEEQDEIVDHLEAVDHITEENRHYRDQLQRFKCGLMQDLLTGEVRTTGKEIDIPDEIKNHDPE